MKTAKPVAAKPVAAKAAAAKPRVAEATAYHAHGLLDTQGHGVVGNVVRGWNVYSEPTLVQRRAVAHEKRKAELVAYFSEQL